MISGEIDMLDRFVFEEAAEIVPLDAGDKVTPPELSPPAITRDFGGAVEMNNKLDHVLKN